MTDDKIEDVLFDINGKLSGISSKLDSLNDTIIKQEGRLTSLETQFQKHLQEFAKLELNGNDDFRTEMLKLLGKALLISLVTVGSLTGAAGLINKLIGG